MFWRLIAQIIVLGLVLDLLCGNISMELPSFMQRWQQQEDKQVNSSTEHLPTSLSEATEGADELVNTLEDSKSLMAYLTLDEELMRHFIKIRNGTSLYTIELSGIVEASSDGNVTGFPMRFIRVKRLESPLQALSLSGSKGGKRRLGQRTLSYAM